MSDRYKRKDAEGAFDRLRVALDKPSGVWFDANDSRQPFKARVGGWFLDYNGAYGGYVIHEYMNEGGGVCEPFGSRRRTARDFCDAVAFALRSLEHKATC